MARVFVTGAGGFVGLALVRTLLARGHSVAALVRVSEPPPGAEVVRGDLLTPGGYRDALAAVDAVVHLAAATGRADARTHHRVNTEGTRLIAAACTLARRPLLFASSVAVQYPDSSRYPYAAAKTAAEVAVRESGARYLIARPTIVAGPGSPVITALARLATLPVVPVFGDGRARLQPVDVDDVALTLAGIVEQDRFGGETIGIGGPEVLTVESLMLAIRTAAGRGRAPVVHLPLALVLPLLGAAERLTGGRVPLTVGQLSLFRYDGTVPSNPVTAARTAALRPVSDMLRRSVGG